MDGLAGLTALITGAAGGIGEIMAERFAAAGARLALVDVRSTQALAARLGSDHRAYALDLESPEAIASTIGQIGETTGIDILVNNAGFGFVFPAAETI